MSVDHDDGGRLGGIKAIVEPDVLAGVQGKSYYLQTKPNALADQFDFDTVRGRGRLLALDLKQEIASEIGAAIEEQQPQIVLTKKHQLHYPIGNAGLSTQPMTHRAEQGLFFQLALHMQFQGEPHGYRPIVLYLLKMDQISGSGKEHVGPR